MTYEVKHGPRFFLKKIKLFLAISVVLSAMVAVAKAFPYQEEGYSRGGDLFGYAGLNAVSLNLCGHNRPLVVPKARDHHDQNQWFLSHKIMVRFHLDT